MNRGTPARPPGPRPGRRWPRPRTPAPIRATRAASSRADSSSTTSRASGGIGAARPPRRAGRCRSTRGRAPSSASPEGQEARRHRREDVHALAGAVREPSRPAPGRPVGQTVDRDLGDPEAGSHGVDRHRRLHPEPASGRTAARAAAVSARCPDSGSDARNPVVAWIDRPAVRFTSPNPPPASGGNTAIATSARPGDGVHEGAERDAVPSRSASANSQMPAGEPVERLLDRATLPAPARCPQDRGAGDQRHRARPVLRAVVHDHHLVREPHERRDRRPDARRLVVGGDQRDDPRPISDDRTRDPHRGRPSSRRPRVRSPPPAGTRGPDPPGTGRSPSSARSRRSPRDRCRRP